MDFNKDIIFDALENNHGELLSVAKDPKVLERIKTDPFFKPFLEDLKASGDKLAGTPIESLPFSMFRLVSETGNREIFQEKYFIHRSRLQIFGMLAWLYDDPVYIKETEDIIWAICDEYTWALPAHISGSGKIRDVYPVVDYDGFIHDKPREDDKTVDLFGTETGLSIAEITHLLEGKLHPKVVYRARKLVNERVIQPFLSNIQFWEDAPMNWCSVCGGNIGATALYLVKDEPTLTLILRRILFNFTQYLGKGFKADGTTAEGLSYWFYGVSRFIVFADLLKDRTCGKLNLLSDPAIVPILSFPEANLLYHSATVCFADCAPKYYGGGFGLMSYLNQYTKGLSPYVWLTDSRSAPEGNGSFSLALRNFIWMDPSDKDTGIPPRTYLLKDGNWVISRGNNDTAFAAKGGSNDESHNHNDVGSFIYQSGTDVILSDLGQGEYTQQYFSENLRYTLLPTSSRGHNVPIIDGQNQKAGKGTDTKDFFCDDKGDNVIASMDIRNAYPNEDIVSAIRSFDYNKNTGKTVLKDVISFTSGKHTVSSRLVSLFDAEIDASGKVQLKSSDRSVTISCTGGNAKASVSKESYSNHFCKQVEVTLIDFTITDVEKAEIELEITTK